MLFYKLMFQPPPLKFKNKVSVHSHSLHFNSVLISKNKTNTLAEMLLLIIICDMINEDSQDIFSNLPSYLFLLKNI